MAVQFAQTAQAARSGPPALAELQATFARALLAATPITELDPLYRQIDGADDIHPDARLRVYRNNALGVQILTLKDIYAACLRILGEECMRTIGRDYLRQHPSTDPDLNRLGERFAEFMQGLLQTRPEFAPYPYLPDLARLEWAVHQAWHAADPAAFDWNRLQEVDDQQGLVFALQPALSLIVSPWPLAELWRGNLGDTCRAPAAAQPLCIHRDDAEVRVEVIDDELSALLEGVRDGATLGALAVAGRPVQRISELLQRGWVVSAGPAEEPTETSTDSPTTGPTNQGRPA